MQPLGVLIGLISTALVPASVSGTPLSDVAGANPVSAIVDGARAALAGDVVSGDVTLALAICAAGIALTQLTLSRWLERG